RCDARVRELKPRVNARISVGIGLKRIGRDVNDVRVAFAIDALATHDGPEHRHGVCSCIY
ncbi:MAG TPA: hypothetical protein VN648_16610, partial [Candidatus Methylomirabilis sp.]|nr:hypothetical protein [Candidatus Methylomirabilis sp.]